MVGMFCALDFILFYVFFEGVLIPMFLIIGVWGGPQPDLCGVQVLSLHAARLGADAAGDPRDLPANRVDRHRVCAEPRQPVFRRLAEMAVARVFRVVRGQGADVAGPYLAARRACRGADRGLGHPRRRAAEDGRLRVCPLFAADVPARLALFHAADLCAERGRGDLHVAGGARADRHEKADRLFVDRPYGLCDDGHFCRDAGGGAGRGHPDAEPRPRVGRAVPVRRRPL